MSSLSDPWPRRRRLARQSVRLESAPNKKHIDFDFGLLQDVRKDPHLGARLRSHLAVPQRECQDCPERTLRTKDFDSSRACGTSSGTKVA